MSSVWASVCEMCGKVGAGDQVSWLHVPAGFLVSTSIDVCDTCCATVVIADLRDKLKGRQEMAEVVKT
jgi:hypothetical protein